MCGCLYWGISYPSDVIKTQVQTKKITYGKAIKNALYGRSLYYGFSVVLLRCVPVNGINFLIYESMQECVKKGVNLSISDLLIL